MKCCIKINGVETVLSRGETLLEILNQAKIPISQSCGGSGSCGTCRLYLRGSSPDHLPRTEIEVEMAEARGFSTEERLACQIEVSLSILQRFEVEIPE